MLISERRALVVTKQRCRLGYLALSVCVRRLQMTPKLRRESYGAKGMHAFIDYHRSDILPSNVERLCTTLLNDMPKQL